MIFRFFRWLITFVVEAFGFMIVILAAFVLTGWIFNFMGWLK